VSAATTPGADARIQALARRAIIGYGVSIELELLAAQAFWLAYAKALIDLSDGTAERLVARDEGLPANYPQAGRAGAWARLSVGVEALTVAQVRERFAAEGMQISSDAAAKFQRNAVEYLKDHEVSAVDGNEYVTALAVLIDDSALELHGASVRRGDGLGAAA